MNPASASAGRPVVQPSAAKIAALTSRSTSESRYRPKALVRPVSRASWPSALSSRVLSWTRVAAASSDPWPSSTAAATPAAPANATTTGGGTRSRANTRTSGCARGRKTRSHTTSVPRRGLRERARAELDSEGPLTGSQQVSRRIELVPDVPEQNAARPSALDVRDDALAIRLLPVLDRFESRVDDPDCFVTQVEQVGVEEGEVVVRRLGAGHVLADKAAVSVRVILVLDPQGRSEDGHGEARDVPRGEDVRMPGRTPVCVHDDPVVDLEPRRLGKLGVGNHAEPRCNGVGLDGAAGAGRDTVARGALDGLAGEHLDALLAVVAGDGVRQAGGEEAMADPGLREEHRDADAVADEPGRKLGTDEAAPDHGDVRALAGDLSQVPVVVERPKPDDALRARNLAWLRAGGEQELLPRILVAGVVRCGARAEVERHDPAPGHELDAFGRLAPELAFRRALPEALREQRPLIGRIRIGADHRDRAVGVVLADALRRHVAGHAGADDQVLGRGHLGLSSGSGIEFQERVEALVLLRAGRAAGEVRAQAGHERVGGCSGELELDVAVEPREALVAVALRLAGAEQAQKGRVEVASGHSRTSRNPAATTCSRSRRRASWSTL